METNFIWGAAIAGNQAEGGWKKDGKGPTITDFLTVDDNKKGRLFLNNDDNYYFPNRQAVDFYGHYKEDIKLFSELGLKALRLSIQWSRIFPNGDDNEPSEPGIIFYKNLLKELKKYEIKPIVTLSHYDCPYSLSQKYNGWESPKMIALYVRFVKFVMEEFKEYVHYWIPFNEINLLTFENEHGLLVGGGVIDIKNKDLKSLSYQVLHHQFIASAKIISFCRKYYPQFKFGCMIAQMIAYPSTPNPEDMLLVQEFDLKSNIFCADVLIKGYYPAYILQYFKKKNISVKISQKDKKLLREGVVDFYSLSYYNTICLGKSREEKTKGNLVFGNINPYLEKSEWGWQIDSCGLNYCIRSIQSRYDDIPIMIVENGLGAKDQLTEQGRINDMYRIDYLRKHIKQVNELKNEGVNIIGYLMWSAIDVISNSTGQISKRYGLIYVDLDDKGQGTLKRYKKNSFYWYRKVIKSNGKDLE